jgi:hypothetical protein
MSIYAPQISLKILTFFNLFPADRLDEFSLFRFQFGFDKIVFVPSYPRFIIFITGVKLAFPDFPHIFYPVVTARAKSSENRLDKTEIPNFKPHN